MIEGLTAKKIYCIGIGGIGLSGLAELLHEQGYEVSGSDLVVSPLTERLASLGITVYDSHESAHVESAELVVYTSAVSSDNPEYQAAKMAEIPLISRGALLAQVMKAQNNIVVTGTHGKTTTSGLLANILTETGVDPTYIIGGLLRDRESPMRLGVGDFFVAEADESDASFLFLSPTVAIITNIDADHMETYHHDFERLKQSFVQVTEKIPESGFVVACIDDPVVRELIPSMTCRVVTYGCESSADYQLAAFQQVGLQSQFRVKTPDDSSLAQLNMPGLHNALNALAAMIVAKEYRLSDEAILKALQNFPGMDRRFHCHGEMKVAGGHALLFDDYGHHPNEIQATMFAAKQAWPDRRMVMVFQPHRYSRTRDLMNAFVDVLKTADQLVLMEVYAASEENIPGADGGALYQAIRQAGATTACFVEKLSALPSILQKILLPNDVVILQGAGNIVTMANKLLGR